MAGPDEIAKRVQGAVSPQAPQSPAWTGLGRSAAIQAAENAPPAFVPGPYRQGFRPGAEIPAVEAETPTPRPGDYARERQYNLTHARDQLQYGDDAGERLQGAGEILADITGVPAILQHFRARGAGDTESAISEGLVGLLQALGTVTMLPPGSAARMAGALSRGRVPTPDMPPSPHAELEAAFQRLGAESSEPQTPPPIAQRATPDAGGGGGRQDLSDFDTDQVWTRAVKGGVDPFEVQPAPGNTLGPGLYFGSDDIVGRAAQRIGDGAAVHGAYIRNGKTASYQQWRQAYERAEKGPFGARSAAETERRAVADLERQGYIGVYRRHNHDGSTELNVFRRENVVGVPQESPATRAPDGGAAGARIATPREVARTGNWDNYNFAHDFTEDVNSVGFVPPEALNVNAGRRPLLLPDAPSVGAPQPPARGPRDTGNITNDPSGQMPQLDTTPSVNDPPSMRMERARRLGFDETPVFHGTGNNIDSFDLSKVNPNHSEDAIYLTTDPSEAGYYARRSATQQTLREKRPFGSDEGANTMPLMLRRGRQLEVPGGEYDSNRFGRIVNKARREGYDTVVFRDVAEQGHDPLYPRSVKDQIAVLRPSNIRSRFAAFDPARKGESDLLAGVALPVAAGGAASEAAKPDNNKSNTEKDGDMRQPSSFAEYIANPDAFPEVARQGDKVTGERIDLPAPLTRLARGNVLSGLAQTGALAEMHRSGVMSELARTPGVHAYMRGSHVPASPIPEWARGTAQAPRVDAGGWGPGESPPMPVGPGGVYGEPVARWNSVTEATAPNAAEFLAPPAQMAPDSVMAVDERPGATHRPSGVPLPEPASAERPMYMPTEAAREANAWRASIDRYRTPDVDPNVNALAQLLQAVLSAFMPTATAEEKPEGDGSKQLANSRDLARQANEAQRNEAAPNREQRTSLVLRDDGAERVRELPLAEQRRTERLGAEQDREREEGRDGFRVGSSSRRAVQYRRRF